jgi:hypothetical protein
MILPAFNSSWVRLRARLDFSSVELYFGPKTITKRRTSFELLCSAIIQCPGSRNSAGLFLKGRYALGKNE